jgi:hypothetical protein
MSRFVTLSRPTGESRFANLRERMEAPLPGEYMASTDPKYAKRDPAFRPQVKVAAKSVANVASVPAAPVKSKAVIEAEKAEARIRDARLRCQAVMASGAYKGREKQAEQLLMDSCSSTAQFQTSSDIIAELGRRATDAEAEKAIEQGRKAQAQAVWDRVNAKHYHRLVAANPQSRAQIVNAPAATVPSANAADTVWDRAWAKVSARRGRPEPAAETTKASTSADSVWDRAWAKIERAKA